MPVKKYVASKEEAIGYFEYSIKGLRGYITLVLEPGSKRDTVMDRLQDLISAVKVALKDEED